MIKLHYITLLYTCYINIIENSKNAINLKQFFFYLNIYKKLFYPFEFGSYLNNSYGQKINYLLRSHLNIPRYYFLRTNVEVSDHEAKS